MALQLTSIGFIAQVKGDGTSTQVTIDLNAGAAGLISQAGNPCYLTKNFNVLSAVGVTDIVTGAGSATGTISNGKVTLTFNTAPTSGSLVGVSGTLVFNQ